MSDDLREQVARAMCERGGFDPDEMISIKPFPRWHAYLPQADAAIAAVVERCVNEIELQTFIANEGPKVRAIIEQSKERIRALAKKEGE